MTISDGASPLDIGDDEPSPFFNGRFVGGLSELERLGPQ